jgi:ABC-type polysaccharide/polyol phosphate export permease
MIVLGWRPAPKALMAIPVLGLFLLNAVAIQIIFGFLAARFRDIAHLTGVLNRILFFTTPVLWLYAETTGLVRQIADLNPFTHLIEAFRAPMMLADPHPNAYFYALLTTAIAWALAILVGGLMRRRLPFWV